MNIVAMLTVAVEPCPFEVVRLHVELGDMHLQLELTNCLDETGCLVEPGRNFGAQVTLHPNDVNRGFRVEELAYDSQDICSLVGASRAWAAEVVVIQNKAYVAANEVTRRP